MCVMTVVLKGCLAPSSRLALLYCGQLAVAAFRERVITSSLLAEFVDPSLPTAALQVLTPYRGTRESL